MHDCEDAQHLIIEPIVNDMLLDWKKVDIGRDVWCSGSEGREVS
jgi:hypothetical protein